MWEKQLCRHQGQWRRRGEEVPEILEWRAFPYNSCWRPWWGRLSPCSSWRSMVEQISTYRLWKGPHTAVGGCLKEAVTQWGSLCWSRLLPGPVAPWNEEPMLEQVGWQVCDPTGDPRWSSLFLKDCIPWEGPTLRQFVKSCSTWEGLMLENFVENCLL